VKIGDYLKEIDRYNECLRTNTEHADSFFFSEVSKKYPEFDARFKKWTSEKKCNRIDLLQFMLEHSEFLNKNENKWMKPVIEVIRKTSLFFQPQIRTKIMNEGWASYWHENLFLDDNRINGHEVDFAKVNAGVTALPRVGLNPYALGLRMFNDIEARADKGQYSLEYMRLLDTDQRKKFDEKTGQGRKFIFHVRENLCDFMFLQTFVDQDFVTKNDLFVAGKRLDRSRMVWQYYVKSRNAEQYRQMLLGTLYHPPHIEVGPKGSKDYSLYLIHNFEGKPLVADYIGNTMMGLEFLWGGPVQLETSEVSSISPSSGQPSGTNGAGTSDDKREIAWQRVVYTMENRKLSKKKKEDTTH
jgi:stage V sporulation protein R